MYDTKILTVEEYIQFYGKPKSEMGEVDTNVLQNFINQAVNQVDSLVSPYSQAGYLFRWYDDLTDTDQDLYKKSKLKRAIGSWVEAMIISGKFWVDNVPTMSSNISYNISSKSNDSRIELKRQDIIQDLTSIGLLSTSNLTWEANEQVGDSQIEEYVIVSKNFLDDNFLKLDSNGQVIKSNIDFAANHLLRTGDINGTFLGGSFYSLTNYALKNISNIEGTTTLSNKPILSNYKLVNCDIGEITNTKWGQITGNIENQLDLWDNFQNTWTILEQVEKDIALKQNKLVAGLNITLTQNVDNTVTISGSGDIAAKWGNIDGPISDQKDLFDDLLVEGDNIIIDRDASQNKIKISSVGSKPNDPKLKSNFINAMQTTLGTSRPKQPLNLGDFLLESNLMMSPSERGRAVIGWRSGIDNNQTDIPKYPIINDDWSQCSSRVLAGRNLIMGEYLEGEDFSNAWEGVPSYSVCYDMSSFLGENKLIKYWYTPTVANNWKEAANKIRIYPETDPTVTTQVTSNKNAIDEINATLTPLETLVSEVETKTNANKTEIDNLKPRVQTNEVNIGNLQTNLNLKIDKPSLNGYVYVRKLLSGSEIANPPISYQGFAFTDFVLINVSGWYINGMAVNSFTQSNVYFQYNSSTDRSELKTININNYDSGYMNIEYLIKEDKQ